jgi:hypothetical protein
LQPLYFLKDGGQIKVYTDASDYAIGGYVCQVIDGKEYPIGFESSATKMDDDRLRVLCYLYSITKVRILNSRRTV